MIRFITCCYSKEMFCSFSENVLLSHLFFFISFYLSYFVVLLHSNFQIKFENVIETDRWEFNSILFVHCTAKKKIIAFSICLEVKEKYFTQQKYLMTMEMILILCEIGFIQFLSDSFQLKKINKKINFSLTKITWCRLIINVIGQCRWCKQHNCSKYR